MPSKVPTQAPPNISKAPTPNDTIQIEEEILREAQDLLLEIERLKQEKAREDMIRKINNMSK